jgi:membrane protein YdbS with pleckstrin-like domain
VSNQRIIIQSGVLSRSLEEIDMRSIDDIEFHQTFLERLFGIGEVYIVSTDKVAPKLALHGIHDPLKIRELIRSTAYQVSQRQLFTRST